MKLTPIKVEKQNWKGSARAARAVFRALAENTRGTFFTKWLAWAWSPKVLDARRVQPHPRAGVLPNPVCRIKIECYAGAKADETPRRFIPQEQPIEVEEVLDRWHRVESQPEWPRADYFKVRGTDQHETCLGNVFPIITAGCQVRTFQGDYQ